MDSENRSLRGECKEGGLLWPLFSERSGMEWLVESKFASTGQAERGLDTPVGFVNRRELDTLLLQSFHLGFQVGAHQIDHCTEQCAISMAEKILVVAGVNRGFCRR